MTKKVRVSGVSGVSEVTPAMRQQAVNHALHKELEAFVKGQKILEQPQLSDGQGGSSTAQQNTDHRSQSQSQNWSRSWPRIWSLIMLAWFGRWLRDGTAPVTPRKRGRPSRGSAVLVVRASKRWWMMCATTAATLANGRLTARTLL